MKFTCLYFAATSLVLSQCGAFAPINNAAVVNTAQLTKNTVGNPLFMAENDDDNNFGRTKSAMVGGAGVNNAGEPPFEIRGFSLGNVAILAGAAVTIFSFADYLSSSGGEGFTGVSGLGFVYGIPIFVAGAALKYAEIPPVPCYSTEAADRIFDEKATEIIKKVKQDVTRHRYGDEAHLDTAVKKLGLVVSGKAYPQMRELRQEVSEDGELSFTMVWQSLDTPYKMWADEKRRQKYESFFGGSVTAEVVKIDAEERLVGIKLTTGAKKAESVPEPSV